MPDTVEEVIQTMREVKNIAQVRAQLEEEPEVIRMMIAAFYRRAAKQKP